MLVRVFCIDDTNKPKEIPTNKWVVKGQLYHMTFIYWMIQQNFQGCDLKEIDLDGCQPYDCFKLQRFAILEEDLELFKQMCETCTQVGQTDIQQLVESLQLIPQE